MNAGKTEGCRSLVSRRGEGLNIVTKLWKAREVEVGREEEEGEIEVECGAERVRGRWGLGPERRGFCGGGGLTKYFERLVEMEVVEGTSAG